MFEPIFCAKNLTYISYPQVANHVTETLQILRNVLEGDYAAISKRLATGTYYLSSVLFYTKYGIITYERFTNFLAPPNSLCVVLL